MYKGEDNIPQQRLPLSKKTKDWKQECIEAFINISSHGTSERKDYLRTLELKLEKSILNKRKYG